MSKEKKDPLLDDTEEGQKATEAGKEPATPVKPVKPAGGDTGVAAKVKDNSGDPQKINQDKVAHTKAILEKAPKIGFLIPLSPGEKPGAYDTCQINGYRLTVQKGVLVQLPLPVANLLAEKYRINMTAGQDKRADRAGDVSQALSS